MMIWRRIFPYFLFLGSAGMAVGAVPEGSEAAADGGPRVVRLLVDADTSARYAGIYMAVERGFYAAEGLDVQLLRRRGAGRLGPRYLAENRCDFAIGTLELMLRARMREGIPLVNIAQFSAHSGLLLVTEAADAIESPAALDGKRISVPPLAMASTRALLARFDAEAVVTVQSPSMDLFLSGAVSACVTDEMDGLWRLLHRGKSEKDLKIFRFSELGFDIPGDGLYCRAEFLGEAAETCRAFTRATVAGWRAVRDAPEEGVRILLHQGNAPRSGKRETWRLRHVLETFNLHTAEAGHLREDAMRRTEEIICLQEKRRLTAPAYGEFHENLVP